MPVARRSVAPERPCCGQLLPHFAAPDFERTRPRAWPMPPSFRLLRLGQHDQRARQFISAERVTSAVASAAYRSGSRLRDERLDRSHDFSGKRGVVHSEVMLPENAPQAWRERERLWNDVEAFEVRKDAQLAREVEFALPREMSEAQGIELARDFARAEFVDRGMIADLNVHWDMAEDGMPKPHAHVMLTMRAVDENGFGQKMREWNRTEMVERWRDAGPSLPMSASPNSTSTRASTTAVWRRKASR
jgi:hypothetical protein